MTSSMPTPNASATSASKAGMPVPTGTAIENVFETLLADIVRGTYVAGSRLPAERELARILGASRPTLREALRRLGEYNLVEPRRGSGVVVRPWREWSLEVLPGYLRYAKVTSNVLYGVTGLVLMVMPYFVTSTWGLAIGGAGTIGASLLVRKYVTF